MVTGSITFAAESQPRWIRWIIPSVGDSVFVALFCLLVFTSLSTRLLGDAGTGWHIRTGQLILSTHSVPRVDPFSSSLTGHSWFAWEWLFDVIVGWLESISGLNGVVTFTSLLVAMTFSTTFGMLLSRGTNLGLALFLVLLAASASMIHFFARPHVVSWLFALMWYGILDSYEKNATVADSLVMDPPAKNPQSFLWLLPVTMLFWVNLHGGFLLGFVFLGIYWVSAAWVWLRPAQTGFEDMLAKVRAGHRFRVLTLIGVLSAGVTLLNPYGFKLHVHIYRYLTNPFLMNHIDEFQSPNFHFVAQKCFAALLLLTLIALAAKKASGRKFRPSERLLILFAVYSGLYASRNIPISSLLLILLAGPRLSKAIGAILHRQPIPGFARYLITPAQFFKRMQTIESGLRGHAWPFAALLLTCCIALNGGDFVSHHLISARFDNKRFPVEALNHLEIQSLTGTAFSPDAWGGYLIYRLYPRMKVVIDDRHDFYGESFLKSYLKTVHLEPEWREFLEHHAAQYLILPKDSPLSNILKEDDAWRLTYSDEVANVFIPAQSD